MRELRVDDATPLYLSWLQSIEVGRFIVYKQQTIEELQQYILQQTSNDKVLFYGIYLKGDRQHIGNVKFIFQDESCKSIEMGIMIGDLSWQGKGVAGEVLSCFAEYAKVKFHSKEMILAVEKTNIPAIKAYKKLGFNITTDVHKPPGYKMTWNF